MKGCPAILCIEGHDSTTLSQSCVFVKHFTIPSQLFDWCEHEPWSVSSPHQHIHTKMLPSVLISIILPMWLFTRGAGSDRSWDDWMGFPQVVWWGWWCICPYSPSSDSTLAHFGGNLSLSSVSFSSSIISISFSCSMKHNLHVQWHDPYVFIHAYVLT